MAKGLAAEILKAKPFGKAAGAATSTPGPKGPADMMGIGAEYKDAGGEAAAQAFLDAIKSHDAKKLLGAFRSMKDICAADEPDADDAAGAEPMAAGEAPPDDAGAELGIAKG